ncbi:MAG TPA: hypothetical protein VL738_38575 [Dactylosporangium sp.]|jgi:hypothetical protein|nr:hypothetical protein [Dactylosporangium sp.]
MRTDITAGLLVGAGGALFAVGNALHPLEHSEAAHTAATWEAAHLIFGLGGLLLAAGLPLLVLAGGAVRPSRLAGAAAILLAVTFAGLAPGAWFEAFIAPLPGGVDKTVEAGPAGTVNAVIGFGWILAVVLFGVALIRRAARPPVRWAGIGLVVAAVVLVAGPGIPVVEGLWIIPASVVAGLALAVTGIVPLRGTAKP